MYTIAFLDLPSFSIDVTLETTPYHFTFHWNSRGAFWVMNIDSFDLVRLVSGVQLVPNFSLLDKYPGRGLPPGLFIAADKRGNRFDITRDNMGVEVVLLYVPSDEL